VNCENIVAIDVETTGLSPIQGHRVIEIAAVRFSSAGLGEEFHSLINCGRSIPPSVQRVHGISDRMLHGQPLPDSVFKRFKKFVGDCVLVAHNASFDCAFLHQEYIRQGWTFCNPVQCTLNLSRRVLPHLRNYRLETVFRHLFPNENEVLSLHRALADARVVARIWLKMKSYLADKQESSMQNT
jgi:DNA polymerase-3 subunit epsilon